MDKLNSLIIALILTAFMGCQKGNPNAVKKSRAVNLTDTLSMKVSETVFSGNFSIKLDSITQDNRCPTTVNCIMAGTAIAKLIVQNDSDKQVVELSLVPKMNPRVPFDTTTVFNHHLRLLDVSPYPGEFGIAQRDYVIKLLVQ